MKDMKRASRLQKPGKVRTDSAKSSPFMWREQAAIWLGRGSSLGVEESVRD